ncbi:CHAT domain-containing protein [Streptomyces rochei]|uniref:CHAT domain-containing protein n=1 Tax=Streptomyces rochei TaxID=1928 RepID=UPI0033E49A49
MGQREDLRAALGARVVRAGTAKDASAVLEPAGCDEAERLVRLVEEGSDDSGDVETKYVLGWFYYVRVHHVPRSDAERELKTALSFLTPCFVAGKDHLPEPLLELVAERAVPVALEWLERAQDADADPALLSTAVDLWRRITRAIPDDHPVHAGCLAQLSTALHSEFQRTRKSADLDEAVEAARGAVRGTPQDHVLGAAFQGALGVALHSRFLHTGKSADLDEAVGAVRTAVGRLPHGDPKRAVQLARLFLLLQARFQRTEKPSDLDEVVEVARACVQATPEDDPGRADFLANLAITLQTRFLRTRQLEDLDEAAGLARTLVQTIPEDDSNYPLCLAILSLVLENRHRRTGRLVDAAEAVETARSALRADPITLTQLGAALHSRFRRTGQMGDLDEAVETAREAVRAAPSDFPHRAGSLSILATALGSRFQRTGQLTDLDEAVEAFRRVVQATPQNHIARAVGLRDLSTALCDRFARTGQLEDVDAAVVAARNAVLAAPHDHPDRAACLSALSTALRSRYGSTRHLADLDLAVDAALSAILGTPHDDPQRAEFLAKLGVALRTRFERTCQPRDLETAVEAVREAVRATPHDHPDRAHHLNSLSELLWMRSEFIGTPEDRKDALSAAEEAADVKTAPPRMRVAGARTAGRMAATSDPGRAAASLEKAVLLLPEVAPRRLRRTDQHHALGSIAAGLAAEATALALADSNGSRQERAMRALTLAEAGRAVLLSQALGTRSDLTELRDRHPALARRLSELQELLDQDSAATAGIGAGQAMRMGQERQRLAAELEDLLVRVRACAGFASFGLPPSPDDLLAEAVHGPVVTFNVSHYRSDALLLTRDGIDFHPLPKLTPEALADRVVAFYRALNEATAPNADRVAAQQTVREILEWLWDAAAGPVLTALGEAIPDARDGQPLPRVWWAPGGLLGLLPLHAAGFHTASHTGANPLTVMDRVISSYTPTVRALSHTRSRQPRPVDYSQSLIVAMPTTPDNTPLRHVTEEALRVRNLLHCPVQLVESAPIPDGTPPPPSIGTPTTSTVLARLPACGIAHFACHGISDRTDPSFSRLLLHDHATTPLTVSALSRANLDHAQLAYLSACNTADPGRGDLLDEAIHLTSAFQLAGFRHVIGTLWPIKDHLAAEIAESFYTHLTVGQPGSLDPDQSATALHKTIRAVRDRYPATPSLWAAHLHVGA